MEGCSEERREGGQSGILADTGRASAIQQCHREWFVCARMREVCGKKEVANPPSFPPSFFIVEKTQIFSLCYSSLISRRVFPQDSKITNIQYLYSIEKLRLVLGKTERRAGMNTGLERVRPIRSWSWEEEEKEVQDGL